MNKVAQLLRFLQFFSHISHNLSYGEEFFEDHAFFGELYPAYEGEYDSVVERMIGLGQKPDLYSIHSSACEMLSKVKFTNNMQAIRDILRVEKALVEEIEQLILPSPMSHPHGGPKPLTQGTVQMLGNIADKSEVRQYKMNQKLRV